MEQGLSKRERKKLRRKLQYDLEVDECKTLIPEIPENQRDSFYFELRSIWPRSFGYGVDTIHIKGGKYLELISCNYYQYIAVQKSFLIACHRPENSIHRFFHDIMFDQELIRLIFEFIGQKPYRHPWSNYYPV